MNKSFMKRILLCLTGLFIILLFGVLVYANFLSSKEEFVVSGDPDKDAYGQKIDYFLDKNVDTTNKGIKSDLVKVDKNGNRYNNSSLLRGEHKKDDFVVTDLIIVSYKSHEEFAKVTLSVEYTGKESNISKNLQIKFKDKDGKRIGTAAVKVTSNESVKKTYYVINPVQNRIIDAYDFDFELLDIY